MPTNIVFTPPAPLSLFDRLRASLGDFIDAIAVAEARRGAPEPFGL